MGSGDVEEAAAVLRGARRVFALTGAGVSAQSGVPTFRGDAGLWRTYRPEDLATPQAFAIDPRLVWEWYAWRQGVIAECAPNAGHEALARMQGEFAEFLLVTQNVDGLHQRSGSTGVVEMHGNIWTARCAREDRPGCAEARRAHPDLEGDGWLTLRAFTAGSAELPPTCTCGGLLRPHIVWFGESLDQAVLRRAFDQAARAEVLLSIGTSSVVFPAAMLPKIAAQTGATVIEVNPQATPNTAFARYALRGGAAEVLPRLLG